MNKIRILIVSNTPWNDSNSFGSSYSNIFGGNEKYEIANIYCRPGLPNTTVCNRFFQITEKAIITNLFRKNKEIGVEVNPFSEHSIVKKSEAFEFGQRHRWRILYWGRNIVWGGRRWLSPALDEFVDSFDPEIIFQPVYYSTYIGEIGLYIKHRKNIPMIGYISDDNYTLRQFSLSPFYWIERLVVRKYVKRVIDSCSILYTITPKQRDEYNAIFGNKCKVLTKGCQFNNMTSNGFTLHRPIRLMYAGGLGSGRWKTLSAIAQAVSLANYKGVKAYLEIYSTTPLSKKQLKKLEFDGCSKFMGSTTVEKIMELQSNSDILVHVEGFALKDRYSARLSFSTKITDYLQLGKCILAVGWCETGAIELLQDNAAAFVITEKNNIIPRVQELISNPDLIYELRQKSITFGERFFDINIIREMLQKDLLCVINQNNK